MAKHTISTLSPVICDSLSLTDKYGLSVENIMDKFSAYPVIVEKISDHWTVTPISHFHAEKVEAPVKAPVKTPVPVKKPKRMRSR